MSSVIIPSIVYLLPAMVVFYVAAEVFLHNRRCWNHRLAALLVLAAHIWFIGEWLVTVLPTSYATEIRIYVIWPTIMAGNGIAFSLLWRLTKRRRIWSTVFVGLLGVWPAIPIVMWGMNDQLYERFNQQGVWKISVPGPHFLTLVIILTTYALIYATILLRTRSRIHTAAEHRQYMIIFSSVMLTTITIALLTLWDFSLIADVSPQILIVHSTLIIVFLLRSALLHHAPIPSFDQLHQMMYRLSPIGSLLINRNGVIQETNAALQKWLGYARHRTIRVPFLYFIEESHQQTFQERLEASFEDGMPIRSMECHIRHRSGSISVVLLEGEFLKMGDQMMQFFMVRDITEQQHEVQQMRHMAYHDKLTGLVNRRYMDESLDAILQQAKINQYDLAVLLIDIDDFKQINDTLGHDAGDTMLREVAEQLHASVRHHDIVARYGGDEFIVVLVDTDNHQVEQITQRMIRSLRRLSAPTRLSITPSVGVSLYPQDAADARTLLKKADLAMYKAKKHGKNKCLFYADMRLHGGVEA